MPIRLASLDIAGTTVDEGGLVYIAVRDAVEQATRRSVPDELLSAWSGTSKFEAIVGLLGALHDDVGRAPEVFARFSSLLDAAYEERPPVLIAGIADAVRILRGSGVQVALQTGYTREVTEAMLAGVGWRIGHDIDAVVTNDDVAASRPAPYLVHRTMEATGVHRVDEVLVAGDTANDLRAGWAAGARYVVGVLTGAHTVVELGGVRLTHLLASAAGLPALLAADGALPHPG